MDRNNAWEKFMNTGNILFYLKYRNDNGSPDMEVGSINGLSEDEGDSYSTGESRGC